MRSNKFISMLAMSAVMVACSQEEIATVENQVAENMNQRPVIGNVDFNFGSEINSRMALKEGSAVSVAFENGDQVGAAIVDVPAYTNTAWGFDYTENDTKPGKDYSGYGWSWADYLADEPMGTEDDPVYFEQAGAKVSDYYTMQGIDYISSNYPYTRNEKGAFETQANLVEGNYMFYMPYNAANLTRQSLVAVLPQVQDCSPVEDYKVTSEKFGTTYATAIAKFYKGEMEGFENAPVLVGHQFLQAPKDGSVIYPNVSMKQIFAYPRITIVNDFDGYTVGADGTGTSLAGKEITVDSIQVYHDDNNSNLFYKKNFDFSELANAMPDWDKDKFKGTSVTSSLLGNVTGDVYPHNNDKETVYLSGLNDETNRVTMVIGKELAAGESYSFNAILPAGNYGQNLKARVYATIEGKNYVLALASRTTGTGAAVTGTASDFEFTDVLHGGEPCVLLHGEQYPKAEILDDGSDVKDFKGSMMTISLKGAHAFALQETGDDYGIVSTAELIDYLIKNVQRNVNVTEYAALREKQRSTWLIGGDEDYPVVQAAAGNIAIAEENTIIINADFVQKLEEQIGEATLTLNSAVLPIAGDVKFSESTSSTGEYTFQTLDEEHDVVINMSALTSIFNTDATKLEAGINLLDITTITTTTTNATLKAKDAGVQNAVVVLDEAEYTIDANTTGISAIYVKTGSTLNVNAACGALIIADGGTIEMGASGSLTNANNIIENAIIQNSQLRSIAAASLEGTTVNANFANSWPTTAIAANTKVNSVSINLNAVNNAFSFEQAQVDVFKNLSNVDLTLGANIQGLVTNATVTLTNIKSITANTTLTWSTGNNFDTKVKKFQWGDADTEITTLSNITAGSNLVIE